jgi:ferredoxin/flavodoxin---NADP+ reductase
LIVRSIGYRNVNIDPKLIPFEEKTGTVANTKGRVNCDHNIYCTGWIKRGPKGVIVETNQDAIETATVLCEDLAKGKTKKKIKFIKLKLKLNQN